MRSNSFISSSPLGLKMSLVPVREEANTAMLLSFPSLRPGYARGREDGAWEAFGHGPIPLSTQVLLGRACNHAEVVLREAGIFLSCV